MKLKILIFDVGERCKNSLWTYYKSKMENFLWGECLYQCRECPSPACRHYPSRFQAHLQLNFSPAESIKEIVARQNFNGGRNSRVSIRKGDLHVILVNHLPGHCTDRRSPGVFWNSRSGRRDRQASLCGIPSRVCRVTISWTASCVRPVQVRADDIYVRPNLFHKVSRRLGRFEASGAVHVF